MITKADKRAADDIRTRIDEGKSVGINLLDRIISEAMQAERDVAHGLFCAVQRFLESSACTNGCSSDDMSCDTSYARKQIKAYENLKEESQ